ncbi:MAG: PAS domain-containing protein [Cyanobacteria bacterium]|nr:PAS domain-containing protein [Cyanobacteria bacterium GSL.Bin1]
MVTALTEKQDLVQSLAAGADDFLSKPLNYLELQARVACLVRIKKQYDQLRALLASREEELRHRQEAEVSLAKMNEQLQAVIDAVPGFISWIGNDLRYRGVNQRLAKAVGIATEEFVGQPLGFLDSAQEFETFIQDFIGKTKRETAQIILSVNFQEKLRENLIVAQKYEQGQSIVTVGIDITKWKQAERELQVTTNQLITLLNTLKSGVLLQDKNWNVILPNQIFYEIFNLNPAIDVLTGQTNSELEDYYQVYFSEPERFCQQNTMLLRGQKSVINEEWTLRDGRILERDYAPIWVDGSCQGHLWMYRDITERKRDEEQLKTSLQEKDLLLKEIHHRVKNNLLVVSNLLGLQSLYAEDEKVSTLLNESQNRVHSMALIHEKLYQSTELKKINFADYLRDLTQTLFDSYIADNQNIELALKLEPVWLNVETANPCGLIVNELISNSLKHGFSDGCEGKVWLELRQSKDNNQITLEVKDNGVGLPPNFDPMQVQSLGMELIVTLTEQIQGELSITNTNNEGASFQITFQELQYRQRY